MSQTMAVEVKIGEVALTVSSLQKAVDFYNKELGLQVLEHAEGQAVLGVTDQPLLQLTENPGAPKAASRSTGLYHFAILLPDRLSLARLIYHLAENEIEVQGAADHGVSEALYMQDPDGNGIELYSDRRRADWPVDDLNRLQMVTEELDLDDLLMELKGNMQPWNGLPPGTTIGHIHLKVSNLLEAERFYTRVLGFDLTQHMPGAVFVSAGGYHHHIGMNTWSSESAPPPQPGSLGLRWFEVLLPDQVALDALANQLTAQGVPFEKQGETIVVKDPSQNTLHIQVR